MTKLFRILLSMLLLASTFSPQMLMTTSVSADYTAPYDLSVTKTIAGRDVDAQTVDFVITYTNNSTGSLTDVYVKDLVPAGLTYQGVISSNPLVGSPVLIDATDPDQLIWTGISLDPNQVATMTVRFAIDEGVELETITNEAKGGVATTSAQGQECQPSMGGEASTSHTSYVASLPPVSNAGITYDLSVSKTVLGSGHAIDPETGQYIFDVDDLVTFRNEVCYTVDPDQVKENIYIEENYPDNLEYISDTAPISFDQHILGKKIVWRGFPIGVDSCIEYDVTYRIKEIGGSLGTEAIIGSVGQYGQNLGPASETNESNNVDEALITTRPWDVSIIKRISAVNGVSCGGQNEPGCAYDAEDEITFELTYTLSGAARDDIVVMDPFPIGTYVSSTPTATNQNPDGTLNVSKQNPVYSLPKYSYNYVYWSDLSLQDQQSETVEFTVRLPSLSCSTIQAANVGYVSIEGKVDDVFFYPLTADPNQTDPDTGQIIINQDIHYLDTHTKETNPDNNVSNQVDISLAAANDPSCAQGNVQYNDLILDSKVGSSGPEGSLIYPGQVIDYTFNYRNDGDGRGYVYLDDWYDADQLEFIEIVSTGSLRKGTDSELFDRWNSDSYIGKQYNALYPHYMERWNNSANYLQNIPNYPNYRDNPDAQAEDSVNYYCFEKNPEFNRLGAQAVRIYHEQYVDLYQKYLGMGYDKDTASIEATAEVMRNIHTWVSANFTPGDYEQSITECVRQGQEQLYLDEGYSPAGAALAAQAYITDPDGILLHPQGFVQTRQSYMQMMLFMNPLYKNLDDCNSNTNCLYHKSFLVLKPSYSTAHYQWIKSYRPYRHGLGINGANYSSSRRTSMINAIVGTDFQYSYPDYYTNPYYYRYHDLGDKNFYSRNLNETTYRTVVKRYLGLDRGMYRDVGMEYTIPQYTTDAQGFGYYPTPEYQGHKSITYQDVLGWAQAGAYGDSNKYQTTPTTQIRGGYAMPLSYLSTEKRRNRDSIAMHNLYLDDNGTGSVTMRFRVKSDITTNTVIGGQVCNSALIATNAGVNLKGHYSIQGNDNGEFTFGCTADQELVYATGDHTDIQLEMIPYLGGTAADLTPAIYSEILTHIQQCEELKTNPDGSTERVPCTYGANGSGTPYRNTDTNLPQDRSGSSTLFAPYNETMRFGTFYSTFSFLLSKYNTRCGGGIHAKMFDRHNDANAGNRMTNRGHNNVSVRGETIPGTNNIQKLCYTLADVPHQMSITNASTTNSFIPGSTVTYNVTACNESAQTMNTMYITDMIPAGLSYTGTLLGNGVDTEDTSTPGEVVWTVSNVPANTCVTLNPQFVISPDYVGTQIDHEVIVAAQIGINGPIVGDDTPANNESTDPIVITQPSPEPAPTLAQSPIKKTAKIIIDENNNGTLGDPGDLVTYEFIYSNNEDTVAYFRLEDDYDPILMNPNIPVLGDNNIQGVDDGNMIVRDGVMLAPKTSQVFEVTFLISPAASYSTSYTNNFAYSYASVAECTAGDTDAGNNNNSVGLPFDLALRKRIADTTPVYSPGDDVTYAITVFNQGIIPATQIVINEEVPTAGDCLSFDAANNTGRTTTGDQLRYTIVGPLAPGAEETVNIVLTLSDTCQEATITNTAEIASALDGDGNEVTDIDSTPDTDLTNDGNVDDDMIDGDYKDNNTEDQDDHDIAQIYLQQSFDLALSKTIVTEGPYHGGDTITYAITVTNQGSLDATGVDVIDYIMTGFTFDATLPNNQTYGWTATGDHAMTTIDSLPINSGATLLIDVTLDYGMEGQTLSNTAEIAAAHNALGKEDVDSTPDIDPTNDPADEDDIDGVDITLGNELDLAIDKMLLTQAPYKGGDELEYVLTIANEGDVVAYDIDVVDYLGTGLSFDPSHTINTTYNRIATGDYAMTTIDEILTGQVAKVHIVVTIDEMFAGETVTNTAEIAAADDDINPNNEPPTDRDSTPDTDPTNDPVTEDDIDEVTVPVGQVIDLAIDKRVNTIATPGPYTAGDLVTFTVTVTNEGEVDTQRIELVDYIPTGFTLTGDTRAETTPGQAMMTLDELTAGASTGVDISFVIDADFAGDSITNTVEIAAADDDNNPDNIPPRDVDSTSDTDQSNDDPTDGDPSNDEDDHDDAMIKVGQEMDLAIDKRITTPAPYVPGQDITYTLTVINEGEVTAALIDLVDYFPSDVLILNDSNWTQSSTGVAMYENAPIVPLAPGASQSVTITFTINETFAGNSIVNTAEIAYQDDDTDRTNTSPTDVDSVPDTDPTNDDPTDGDITNDEDDHDDEMISLGGPRLAGTIYHDTNNSDSYDTNDIPLSGLVVTLTNGSGDVVATTTTDAAGDYAFENLVADIYSVSYDPATQDPTLHPDGLTVYADSNQIGNEGGTSDGLQMITGIQLDGTDTGFDYDFGLIATSSLGGTIFFDYDNTDAQDHVNDRGLSGYVVTLTNDAGDVVATTTTNVSGDYLFTGLLADIYSVTYTNTGDYVSDSAIPGTLGGTASDDVRQLIAITIADGQHSADNDFGLIELASLAGTIYFDAEDDDLYTGNQGLSGLVVTLYNGSGELVATTTTNGSGDYSFPDLIPGEYRVGYAPDTTLYPAYTPDSLIPGSHGGTADGVTLLQGIMLAGGDESVDNDFGLIPGLSLAGTIFYDDENDDVYTGDSGVAGQVVTLTDATGNVIATTMTNAAGDYLFTGLAAGEYVVTYTNSSTFTPDSLIPGTTGGAGSGVQTIGSIILTDKSSVDNDFGLILVQPVVETIRSGGGGGGRGIRPSTPTTVSTIQPSVEPVETHESAPVQNDVDLGDLADTVKEYQESFRFADYPGEHLRTGIEAEQQVQNQLKKSGYRFVGGSNVYHGIPSRSQTIEQSAEMSFEEHYDLLPASARGAGAYYVGFGVILPIMEDTQGYDDDALIDALNQGLVMTPGSAGLAGYGLDMIYGHASSTTNSEYAGAMVSTLLFAQPGSMFSIYVREGDEYVARDYIVESLYRDIDPQDMTFLDQYNAVGRDYLALGTCQAGDVIGTLQARKFVVAKRVNEHEYAQILDQMYSVPQLATYRAKIYRLLQSMDTQRLTQLAVRAGELFESDTLSGNMRTLVGYIYYSAAYLAVYGEGLKY